MTTKNDDQIIEEFKKLFYDTDWQEMPGDELVDIKPEEWLARTLSEARASERVKVQAFLSDSIQVRDEVCIHASEYMMLLKHLSQ